MMRAFKNLNGFQIAGRVLVSKSEVHNSEIVQNFRVIRLSPAQIGHDLFGTLQIPATDVQQTLKMSSIGRGKNFDLSLLNRRLILVRRRWNPGGIEETPAG